ncbi:MAG: hypothetical protein AB7O24_01150 [Kofleriaceae bacterium]
MLPLCAGKPELEQVMIATYRHVSNAFMALKTEAEDREPERLRQRIEILERAKVDIQGESGSNGRLGNLTKTVSAIAADVDKILSRAWWLFTLLVAGLGGAAVKLVVIGKAYGELETTVQNMKAQDERQSAEIVILHQQLQLRLNGPAEAPGKDSR